MAKNKANKKATAPKNMGGPFLAAAVFCDGILEDMNGVLTVQRIIDRILVVVSSQAPPDVPSEEHPVQISPVILLIFRSGDSPGKHALKLVVEQPNGKRVETMVMDVDLGHEANTGVNFKANAAMDVFSSGLFLIDVFLDGKLFTRMPLDVTIKRGDVPVGMTKPDASK